MRGDGASGGPGLQRFGDRIEALLRRDPVDLPVDEHRERVARLLTDLAELNFFELLGVGPGARDEEVHAAYLDLARLVHPVNAERTGISGGRAALEILFERVTEAYRTLIDPDRYRRYVESHPESAWTATHPRGAEREEEARREATRQLAAARRFAVDGRYHDAIETLQQAILLDERAELFALMGQCEAHNPNWRGRAVASYQRAIALDPDNAVYRVELARLFESVGQTARARMLVEQALRLAPRNEEALAARERLAGGSDEEGAGGLLARLFRRGPDSGGDR